MKKVILTMMIALGLAFTASAQKKGHKHHSDKGHHNNHHYDRGHHNGHYNRGHHNGHYNRGHRGSYGSTVYITKKIWVEGTCSRVWVPPRYEYVRQPCGRVIRVCVSQGYYKTIRQPGYYTYKRVPVYRESNRCNTRSGLSFTWRF